MGYLKRGYDGVSEGNGLAGGMRIAVDLGHQRMVLDGVAKKVHGAEGGRLS